MVALTGASDGAKCRSPVVRDRYKGDAVELFPKPKARVASPGRSASWRPGCVRLVLPMTRCGAWSEKLQLAA